MQAYSQAPGQADEPNDNEIAKIVRDHAARTQDARVVRSRIPAGRPDPA
jgi:hypothetical protein